MFSVRERLVRQVGQVGHELRRQLHPCSIEGSRVTSTTISENTRAEGVWHGLMKQEVAEGFACHGFPRGYVYTAI